MTAGDRYREQAVKLAARANSEADPRLRAHYEVLSFEYVKLAEYVDKLGFDPSDEEIDGLVDL